jgi:hypothetical protein
MQIQECRITSDDGLEIIKIWIPADPPDRLEHFIMYRVPGYKHHFLSSLKAWEKSAELKEAT